MFQACVVDLLHFVCGGGGGGLGGWDVLGVGLGLWVSLGPRRRFLDRGSEAGIFALVHALAGATRLVSRAPVRWFRFSGPRSVGWKSLWLVGFSPVKRGHLF